MRIGSKYAFRSLRADAIKRLDAQYPSSYSLYASWTDPKVFIECGPRDVGPLLIDTINLAREMGIPRLLPMLFLRLCHFLHTSSDQLSYDLLLRCWRRADGTQATLSAENSVRCIVGLSNLREHQLKRVKWWIEIASSGACDECKPNIYIPNVDDIMRRYPATIKEEVASVVSCQKCMSNISTYAQAKDCSILTWNGLPEVFNLSPWSQLTEISSKSLI